MSSSEELHDLLNFDKKNENKKSKVNKYSLVKLAKKRNKSFNFELKDEENGKIYLPQRDLQVNFGLNYIELYEIHIKKIEEKTNLKRKSIYIFLFIALFFLLLGFYECIFVYIITGYYPIKWTIEDYKFHNEKFYRRWGTYWILFFIFFFLDFYRDEILKIIPLYFIIRTIILLILYLPNFDGAVYLYDGVLEEMITLIFSNKNEDKSLLNEIKRKFGNGIK